MRRSHFRATLFGLLLAAASSSLYAHRYGGGIAIHHGFVRPYFGFYYGAPYLGPPYYAFPYAYPPVYSPPVYVAPPSPPVYIEPGSGSTNPSVNSGFWHYCSDPEGYFPHVSTCPGGWQPVEQQPIGEEPGFWYYCSQPAGYYPYVGNCSERWRKIRP